MPVDRGSTTPGKEPSLEAELPFSEWWEKVEGRKLTKEEEEFIEGLERYQQKYEGGRKLTHQQKHLALVQAELLGEL